VGSIPIARSKIRFLLTISELRAEHLDALYDQLLGCI
jgi:hypothetical protein